MWMYIVGVVVLFSAYAHGQRSTTTPSQDREPKFSLFTIVKYEAFECATTFGMNGTCYTDKQCRAMDGKPMGSCALGFGVCCLVTRGCGDSSNINNTYFIGPSSLGTKTGFCQLSLLKPVDDVCQYKVEIESLELSPPDANGVCQDDRMTVTGLGSRVPPICGSNPDQHFYIETGNINSPTTITISGGIDFTGRRWKMKIIQIPCKVTFGAPSGCLQYFTKPSGVMKSFNWNRDGGRHLANQDYAICIRNEFGYCSVCLTQCEASPASGSFSLFSAMMDYNSINSNTAGACSKDFFTIDCGQEMSDTTTDCLYSRFCGGTLNARMVASAEAATVCTKKKPTLFRFVTDGTEAADTKSSGFCLKYSQRPC